MNPNGVAVIDLIPTFAALAGKLAERGFVPGKPPGLSPHAEGTDRLCLKRMKCPNPRCRHKGLDYRPYHAPGRYAVLAVCPACLCAEQF
jgi:hypothetical protein